MAKGKQKKIKDAKKKFWRRFLIIKGIMFLILIGLLIYFIIMFKQRIL